MLSRVFGFGRRSFDSLSEQEILALAISSEEDDGRIYRAYADGLREDFPQSAKMFDAMADEEDLAAFLKQRRLKNKRPCQPGEIYCVRCRAPQKPAEEMAEYRPLNAKLGNLIGICPCCESLVYRRVNPSKLDQIKGNLNIAMPKAEPRIDRTI